MISTTLVDLIQGNSMGSDGNKFIEDRPRASLFDLPETQGVNESERILTGLCRRTFLRLWSQTND